MNLAEFSELFYRNLCVVLGNDRRAIEFFLDRRNEMLEAEAAADFVQRRAEKFAACEVEA